MGPRGMRSGEGRSPFKISTGKPTGKRPLGRPKRRWEDNIRMDLEEISIIACNWNDSAQDRDYWRALVNAALKLRVPLSMELVNIYCVPASKKLRMKEVNLIRSF